MSEPRSVSEDQRLNPDTWSGESPAYPWGDVTNGGVMGGLSKRELFAAMAMQGHCANSIPGSHHGFENTAREAVQYADALLKELAK